MPGAPTPDAGLRAVARRILYERVHVGGADRSIVGPILCKLVFQFQEIGGHSSAIRKIADVER
jgi:hypothetical protein